MKKIISLILVFYMIFLVGCGPKLLETDTFKPEPLDFNKTAEYTLDLSSIQKPEMIKPLFVNENFEEVPVGEAKYVLLTPKEYAKVGALVKLAKTYKEIAIEESNLINIHIDTINSLKEFVALERMKSDQYRQLWINSENMYRQERYEHQKSNMINSIQEFILIVGGVAIIGFML